MEMTDEFAAMVFAKALYNLLEPGHGIIIHVADTGGVMIFRNEKEEAINCSEIDPELLEIPDGTICPVMCHYVENEEDFDPANFVLPPTGKLN